MLRVNSNCILVVPPFECAWLSGDEYLLRNGEGCISFEVKGDNDVTIIIKPAAGSKRWQHMQRAGNVDLGAPELQVDPNYTVILGSHGNRCLKIEKNGSLCCMVDDVAGARLPSHGFGTYWLDYNKGTITVGTGPPGSNAFHRWCDPRPLQDVRYVGLSSWDKHVGYKSIRVGPAVDFEALAREQKAIEKERQAVSDGPAPLTQLATDALVDSLTPNNAVHMLGVAHVLAPAVESLHTACVAYIARNVERLLAADPKGVGALPASYLRDLLRHPEMDCSEMVLFNLTLRWMAYGRTEGSAYGSLQEASSSDSGPWRSLQELEEVLPLIRFPLMSDSELQAVAEHPVATRSSLLQELLREAGHIQIQSMMPDTPPVRRPRSPLPYEVQDKRLVRAASLEESLAATRFQRRHPPAWRELIFIYDGDTNGVCHYLGTNLGTEDWVNPVLAGRMVVKASSPSCRSTDPKGLAGHQFLRTNFAGPAYEGGRLVSWWLLDLGERHRLVCNYYSMRHDGSQAFARSWVLQASVDGEQWVDLRQHLHDTTLKLPGQYGSWPVSGPQAAAPFRLFRVLMVGPSADAHSPHNLSVSNLEFYGYFSQVGQQPPQQ